MQKYFKIYETDEISKSQYPVEFSRCVRILYVFKHPVFMKVWPLCDVLTYVVYTKRNFTPVLQ